MKNQKRMLLSAVIAAAIGATGAVASAAEPTVQDMQKQIEALQAQLSQLQATQQSQLSARDVDLTVDKVLADAHKRSQLLQLEGFTAGYSNGKFLLQSADGNYSFSPYMMMQFRHVLNYADSTSPSGKSDSDHGFEIRRLKFGMNGNVITKNLGYTIVWNTDYDGGDMYLEDAIIKYKFDDSGWTVFGGQFKDPVHHERMMDDATQLAVDRSMADEYIGGGWTGRTQGIGLTYENDVIKGTVAYTDGNRQMNTMALDNGPDFGITGRLEWLVMGDRANYNSFSALGTKEDMLVIGGGANWTEYGSTNVLYHTVDAQYESAGGLALYGAYLGAYGDYSSGSTYDWGLVAQAAYLIPDSQWEVFGRYSLVDYDNVSKDLHEIAVGFNHYLRNHNAKITVDVTYLPNGAGTGDVGVGYVASGDKDQVVLRSQFQLVL